jgi:uncharacterized protein YecT (DUF1311 family)
MSSSGILLAAGIAATIALLAPLAHADCASATTQAAMNTCAAADFARADAALNATYAEVMARLARDEQGRARLVAAERAWLTFRDAQCAFETSRAEGGSIHPMLVAICRAGLTVAREKSLRAFLHGQEGDLACPVPPG